MSRVVPACGEPATPQQCAVYRRHVPMALALLKVLLVSLAVVAGATAVAASRAAPFAMPPVTAAVRADRAAATAQQLDACGLTQDPRSGAATMVLQVQEVGSKRLKGDNGIPQVPAAPMRHLARC
jgi:hypothetical protein